jgi:polar amino acid transport system substrate-binding protein
MRTKYLAAALVAALTLVACGDDDTTPAGSSPDNSAPADSATAGSAASGTAAECAKGKTLKDGVLTIATGEPAFEPYVVGDKPESGEGFEAAVALAVAAEMGFDPASSVTWVRTSFDGAIAPGPKDFDFNLQQFTITDERKQSVDFSEGYYTAAQAIFGLQSSAGANATTLADLKALKIGVAAGTTSVTYVEEVIQPDAELLIFNDNAAAKAALESNQIDAVVSDLPTALFIANVEFDGAGKVFGQIEGSGTDEFGLLLPKDSPLTECADLALSALKDSGELEQITTKWMSEYTEAPIISLS